MRTARRALAARKHGSGLRASARGKNRQPNVGCSCRFPPHRDRERSPSDTRSPPAATRFRAGQEQRRERHSRGENSHFRRRLNGGGGLGAGLFSDMRRPEVSAAVAICRPRHLTLRIARRIPNFASRRSALRNSRRQYQATEPHTDFKSDEQGRGTDRASLGRCNRRKSTTVKKTCAASMALWSCHRGRAAESGLNLHGRSEDARWPRRTARGWTRIDPEVVVGR